MTTVRLAQHANNPTEELYEMLLRILAYAYVTRDHDEHAGAAARQARGKGSASVRSARGPRLQAPASGPGISGIGTELALVNGPIFGMPSPTSTNAAALDSDLLMRTFLHVWLLACVLR